MRIATLYNNVAAIPKVAGGEWLDFVKRANFFRFLTHRPLIYTVFHFPKGCRELHLKSTSLNTATPDIEAFRILLFGDFNRVAPFFSGSGTDAEMHLYLFSEEGANPLPDNYLAPGFEKKKDAVPSNGDSRGAF